MFSLDKYRDQLKGLNLTTEQETELLGALAFIAEAALNKQFQFKEQCDGKKNEKN